MARQKKDSAQPKVTEAKSVAEKAVVIADTVETAEVKAEKEYPEAVDRLLKMYPNYKKLYVTKDGFVHPENATKSLVEGLTLYDNPYFNNN